jgi:hypothetical protein
VRARCWALRLAALLLLLVTTNITRRSISSAHVRLIRHIYIYVRIFLARPFMDVIWTVGHQPNNPYNQDRDNVLLQVLQLQSDRASIFPSTFGSPHTLSLTNECAHRRWWQPCRWVPLALAMAPA